MILSFYFWTIGFQLKRELNAPCPHLGGFTVRLMRCCIHPLFVYYSERITAHPLPRLLSLSLSLNPNNSPSSFTNYRKASIAMKIAENERQQKQLNNLSKCQNLIQSLLDSIPHTKTFKGKWSIIGTKLSHLKTQLSDFPTNHNSLSLDFLHSLSLALSQALSLSQTCPTAGKLKTQNDIDSISAKLDLLIRDSEVLIKSCVMHDGVASTSKRDSLRVESRNLITRLQIGTTESKNSAIDSLQGTVTIHVFGSYFCRTRHEEVLFLVNTKTINLKTTQSNKTQIITRHD